MVACGWQICCGKLEPQVGDMLDQDHLGFLGVPSAVLPSPPWLVTVSLVETSLDLQFQTFPALS